MDVKILDLGEIRVLEFLGRLTLSDGAKIRRRTVRSELDGGKHRLLLDLSQVSMIDSTGLGVLVSSHTSALNRRGALALLRPSPKVEDVLKITLMDRVLRIFQNQGAAVEWFENLDNSPQ